MDTSATFGRIMMNCYYYFTQLNIIFTQNHTHLIFFFVSTEANSSCSKLQMILLFLTRFIQSHTMYSQSQPTCMLYSAYTTCTASITTPYRVCLLKQRFSIPSQAFSIHVSRIIWKSIYRTV